MHVTNTTAETYAQWLERKMTEGGLSQRALARKWKPTDAETARRALRRYLNGMVPIARTRLEIAAHLPGDDSEPAEGDEDAEGD